MRFSLTKRCTCIHSPFYFQAKCVAENSGLAEIETEAENNFLKDVAAKTLLNGKAIGLYKLIFQQVIEVIQHRKI